MSELSVLIVEDDEDFRASVASLVGREGYRTLEAGSLAAARERLNEITPDVVLLDLELPDGDGLDLIGDEEIANATEFVVMTGHAAIESSIESWTPSAMDMLREPPTKMSLLCCWPT